MSLGGASTGGWHETGGAIDEETLTYSRADITATEQDRYADDLPILAGYNLGRWLERAEWRDSGSFASGSDLTDPDYPVSRLYDLHHHLPTRPRSSAASPRYLLLELSPTGPDIDVVAILGHNAIAVPGPSSAVALQIADDEAFTSNLETIVTWSSDLDVRLVSTFLGSALVGVTQPQRYSSARYLRLRFSSAGSTLFLPEVSEIMLLRRQAISKRPDAEGYDEDRRIAHFDIWRGDLGTSYTMVRATGQRVVEAKWTCLETEPAARFREAYRSARGGKDRMLWIEHPESDPRSAHVVSPSSELVLPDTHGLRESSLTLEEIPPYVSRE